MLHPKYFFSTALDISVLTTLCILQFAFVFGLPWVDNGIWPQVEGPAAAIHLLSALLALLVGVKIAMKDSRYIEALSSWVVVALFAFAFVGLALSPFSDSPMRSINGTMKHGVGVLWNFELAVATLAAVALWRDLCMRRVLVGSVVLAAAIVIGLYLYPENPLGIPLGFYEWVGMLALSAAGIVLFDSRKPRGEGHSFSLYTILIAATLAIMGYAVSENRAVLLAAAAITVFFVSDLIPGIRYLINKPSVRAASVVAVIVSLTIAVYAAGPYIEKRIIADGPSSYSTYVQSEAVVDKVAVQDSSMGTIWSRSYLVRVLFSELNSSRAALLTGFGFGHFSEAYEHNMRDVPGRLFSSAVPSASLTYWDAHTSANFHSHNMLAETLMAVGIPGVIAWLSVFAAMSWGSRSGTAAALGIAVIGSLWFPVNHMLGGLAVLLSATAAARPVGQKATNRLSGAGSLIAVFGFSILGYFGVAATALGVMERAERGFQPVKVDTNPMTCGFIKTHMFPEEEIVSNLYAILQNKIKNSGNPKKELFDASSNIISINCMLRRYADHDGNMQALTASLEGRAKLMENGPVAFGALKNEILKWGDDLETLLDNVPGRTELLAPYIASLSTRAPHKVPEEVARFLPRLSESDPIRNYVLAFDAKAKGDAGAYRLHLSLAMRQGLGNLWPLTRKENNSDEVKKP